jgi:hypothetical protein
LQAVGRRFDPAQLHHNRGAGDGAPQEAEAADENQTVPGMKWLSEADSEGFLIRGDQGL